jgi:hypothetical protein
MGMAPMNTADDQLACTIMRQNATNAAGHFTQWRAAQYDLWQLSCVVASTRLEQPKVPAELHEQAHELHEQASKDPDGTLMVWQYVGRNESAREFFRFVFVNWDNFVLYESLDKTTRAEALLSGKKWLYGFRERLRDCKRLCKLGHARSITGSADWKQVA